MTKPSLIVRPCGGLDLDRAAYIYGEAFSAPWEQRWTARLLPSLLAMPGAFGLMAEPAPKAIHEPGYECRSACC